MKHTSTVLEPSIPFHTLVKLVDAEDIDNDTIELMILHLKSIPLQINYNHKTWIHNNLNNLCFTQTRDSNHKHI